MSDPKLASDAITDAYNARITAASRQLVAALEAAGYQVTEAPDHVKIIANLILTRWSEAALTYRPGTDPLAHIADYV